jgi:hypothetical protein
MNGFKRAAGATLLFTAIGLGMHGVARAQVYQPGWTARPVPDESPALGAAVGFGDNMFRIAGHARFSMTSASDLGLELVFDNFEDDIGDDSQRFGFGGDYKYLVVPEGEKLPFDLAAQGGFGMEFGSDVTTWSLPLGMLGSKSIPVDNDTREITPFAGMYIIIDHFSVEAPGDNSETDVSAEIRFGSAFQIAGRTHAFAALHTGNGTMFFLGFTAGL